ncbi:hypothetical protein EVAR_102005_1, partial [Eumeta japonica]
VTRRGVAGLLVNKTAFLVGPQRADESRAPPITIAPKMFPPEFYEPARYISSRKAPSAGSCAHAHGPAAQEGPRDLDTLVYKLRKRVRGTPGVRSETFEVFCRLRAVPRLLSGWRARSLAAPGPRNGRRLNISVSWAFREFPNSRAKGALLRLGVTLKKCNARQRNDEYRTERPAECLASLSHSIMIGLPLALNIESEAKQLQLAPAPPERTAAALTRFIYAKVNSVFHRIRYSRRQDERENLRAAAGARAASAPADLTSISKSRQEK